MPAVASKLQGWYDHTYSCSMSPSELRAAIRGLLMEALSRTALPTLYTCAAW